ncbi:DUF930 domain-containing protein [Phyllobacterium sp. P30BS-XVII]|uniref:DUF930 domain-containing protein n=1 Tax=Phyllobacterium sp. P30BS-XVII TaxID=2587046 RepID=UPI000DD5C290|nr:DUF930 domain-containing protein [Phyllobacterium sp. P30BS-XVII]MBA8899355.1 hypothetical protein [Phyllobacterium sp. P30BS-XVII]
MLQYTKKLRAELGAGVLTSVVLHLLVAALLLFQLPEWKPTPPEQESVKVEIVPPPKPEPQPKPEPEKKEEKVEAPKPQPAPAPAPAPAASSDHLLKLLPRSEKESTEDKKPPSGEGETQDAASTPQDTATEQAKADAGPGATPVEAQPAVPNVAELQSTPTPSETAGQAAQPSPTPTASLKDAPTPQQKSEPQPKKAGPAFKPNGSRAMKSSDPFADLNQQFLPSLDPRMGQIVARLSPEVRLRNLCSDETIARLRSKSGMRRADILLRRAGPTGGAVTRTSFNVVQGAFRNDGNWYNIDLQCSVNAGISRVISLTYTIGRPIPRNEWRQRNLPN